MLGTGGAGGGMTGGAGAIDAVCGGGADAVCGGMGGGNGNVITADGKAMTGGNATRGEVASSSSDSPRELATPVSAAGAAGAVATRWGGAPERLLGARRLGAADWRFNHSASSAAFRASARARSSSSASPAACAARRSHTMASWRSFLFQSASAVCRAQATSSVSDSSEGGMPAMAVGIGITRRAPWAAPSSDRSATDAGD
jgi:hypothetical protein